MESENVEYFNRKFGSEEIFQAIWDWSFHRNAFPNQLRIIEKNLKKEGYLVKIIDTAYSDGYAVQLEGNLKGVYIKGDEIYPRVPNDVIRLAEEFIPISNGEKLANKIYNDVCKTKKWVFSVNLGGRLFSADIELNFVADMLRKYNHPIKADRLEKEVQKYYPKFYHGAGLEPRICTQLNVNRRMIHY